MAAQPPRKRQRRLVVHSSDEDESYVPFASSLAAPASHRRLNTRLIASEPKGTSATCSIDTSAKNTRHSRSQSKKEAPRPSSSRATSTRTSPATSPEKRRTRKQPEPDKSASSKSLHSFFAPATEEQRWSKVADDYKPDILEEIEDEDIEEELLNWNGSRSFNMVTSSQGARQGQGTGSFAISRHKNGSNEERKQNDTAKAAIRPKPIKKFVMPPDLKTGKSDLADLGDHLKPWAERFGPADLDELAVHKKKVADVQRWLVDVFMGRSKRAPAGSGKTTTVSLLSKTIGYEIIEWKNSSGSEYSSAGYVSTSAQFDDFLSRTDKFRSLSMSQDSLSAKSIIKDESTPSSNRRRIILIEEFPTSLSHGSSSLMAFRSSLERYLATTVPSMGFHSRPPRPDNESDTPIVIIVSETLLGTGAALSDNFTVFRLLGPEISNHPGVSIIEFNPVAPTFITKALDLVLKKEARISKRRRVPGPAALKSFAEMGDIRSAIASLEFLCIRGDKDGDWSGTVANTQTFIAALHENYILSCESEDFTDFFADCISELSNADILAVDSRRGARPTRSSVGSARFSSRGSGKSVDLLRQDEMSFQVAVRGLLFSLPYPVRRRAMPDGQGGDVYKMFFPTSMRLWRETEELSGLLDMWCRRLIYPVSSTHNPCSGPRTEGIESWGSYRDFTNSGPTEDAQTSSMPTRTMMSSQEVLLDYLPYQRMITKDPSEMGDLDRLIRFRGMIGRTNDITDEDFGILEDLGSEHWATDPVPKSPQKRRISRKMLPPPRPRPFHTMASKVEEDAVEKLVLSDDDIED
ncbi:cell cycle checkpoint protein RAD17 [Coccidioides immitis RMSCC 3703]|uniref:Cell cycle checkpoint protein RAD17 n=1 Tax=Coccidioides immitis RMSCC 3703 TaxID=454286 RepID=A0A0J8RA03_COCIT|nr:cell cycle checkpoint protein RAD17 [Coccidioides immitis RMSCC 3703]